MNVTIFTGDQLRHKNFLNLLSNHGFKCKAIIEKSNQTKSLSEKNQFIEKYFNNVKKAEEKYFSNSNVLSSSIDILEINYGELNNLSIDFLRNYLNSDLFFVFGSSYIKSWLVDFLISKNALNLHMGISPYYRGTACNFWAIYDGNPHLNGGTVHYLAKGIDDGKILFHVIPKYENESLFEFSMKSVISTQIAIIKKLKNSNLLSMKSETQIKSKQIRYSRNKDFTKNEAMNFLLNNSYNNFEKLIQQKLKNIELTNTVIINNDDISRIN